MSWFAPVSGMVNYVPMHVRKPDTSVSFVGYSWVLISDLQSIFLFRQIAAPVCLNPSWSERGKMEGGNTGLDV